MYSLALPVAPGIYELMMVLLYDETALEPAGLADGRGVELSIGTLRVE